MSSPVSSSYWAYGSSLRRASSPSRTMSTSRSAPGISGLTRGVGSSSTSASSAVPASPSTTPSSPVASTWVSSAASSSDSATGSSTIRCSGSSWRSVSAACSSGGSGGVSSGSSARLSSAIVLLLLRIELERARLLGSVRVLGTRVHLELGQLLARQAVLGKHPLHGEADDLLGPPLEHVVERARLEPARVAGVAVVHLLLPLLARDGDLLRVDDDDEVARVHVRRVDRLALAAQRVGDLGGEAAEGLALGVDQEP